MQVLQLFLSCTLLLGSAAFLYSDFHPASPEQSRSFLAGLTIDDGAAADRIRTRLSTDGYGAADQVFSPALERDPASSYKWVDRGEALLALGKRDQAEYCYLRASQLAPFDRQTLLDVGDFYVADENRAPAIQYLSRLLREIGISEADPFNSNIFTYYERLEVRRNGLIDSAIPDAPAGRAYTRYLMRQNGPDAARELYTWVSQKGFDDDALAIEYANYMVTQRQFGAAADAWQGHFRNEPDGYPRSTVVFNGGFEKPLTGGAPDWRLQQYSRNKATRDSHIAYEGSWSLRVEFTQNDNPDFHEVAETIFVKPGRYRLTGFLRTQTITSDQGVRLRIVDPSGKLPPVETPPLAGTNDWTKLTADLTVPPGVTALEIQLARHRSIRIDNQLSGTVWIDAVSLKRAADGDQP